MKMTLFISFFLFGLGCTSDPLLPRKTEPDVATTISATNISTSGARTGGMIISNGNDIMLERGVCWSTSQNPSTSNSKIADPGGIGSFVIDIISLNSGVTYYVRAYARNSVGTRYGNQISFSTLSNPTVSTNLITSIGTTSAIGGGNVTSTGGSSVTTKGICWSTSINPTTALTTKTTNGSGTGSFSASMTGLISLTTYYVRAYATNSIGTTYGANVSFRTN